MRSPCFLARRLPLVLAKIAGTALLALGMLAAHAERVVTDMAGRQVQVPDTVRRVYAEGHCLSLVGAVAPEKLLNLPRMSDDAKRLLGPAFTQDKHVPEGGMRFSDEEIVRMAPDLIVLEIGPGAIDNATQIGRAHV